MSKTKVSVEMIGISSSSCDEEDEYDPEDSCDENEARDDASPSPQAKRGADASPRSGIAVQPVKEKTMDDDDCYILDYDPFDLKNKLYLFKTKGSIEVIDIPSSSCDEEDEYDSEDSCDEREARDVAIPGPQAKRGADASSSSGIVVKTVKEKMMDDDDCCILDYDPFDSVIVDLKNKLSLFNGDQEDDLYVLAEKGQVACRDYPHSRHTCAEFPFGKTPHEDYCAQGDYVQEYFHLVFYRRVTNLISTYLAFAKKCRLSAHLCFCYVCDVPAPCLHWKGSVSSHCHASDQQLIWRNMRCLGTKKIKPES